MKIGITGANGYIGSTLVRKLSSVHEIIPITRAEIDLLDTNSVNKYFTHNTFDVLIHTAINGGSRLKIETYSDLDNNLKMYYNLLDNRNSFTKFISIGSGAELYSLDTPYGLSKHVIRQSILEKENFYNIRVFAVFDENELPTRFIKGNVQRYINKESMVIHQDKKMDFFHMEDFVKVVEYYISESSPSKEFNCTYEQTYLLSEIAEKINTLSTYKVPIEIQSTSYGKPYSGVPNGDIIYYSGLDVGIKKIYEHLLCRT